jgi:Protein of unknown function (DUF2934)
MSDRTLRISEYAYHLWVQEGRPHGRDIEHWLQAERELSNRSDIDGNQTGETASDPHGISAAEKYNREVRESVASGKSEQAAHEAKKAVEGPERETLKRAEEAGKRASKGNEAGGTR